MLCDTCKHNISAKDGIGVAIMNGDVIAKITEFNMNMCSIGWKPHYERYFSQIVELCAHYERR